MHMLFTETVSKMRKHQHCWVFVLFFNYNLTKMPFLFSVLKEATWIRLIKQIEEAEK